MMASAPGQEQPSELGQGVLIVDDSQLMIMRMRELVERHEYTVAGTAGSGEQALGLLRKVHPRLIILDHNLPQMSGLEFLKRLRQTDKQMRVIVCSGTLTLQAGRDFLAAGADELLAKPVQLDQFVRALHRCMAAPAPGA
jgi:two-component system, chemotaxis family, chemotaxis protein CheY